MVTWRTRIGRALAQRERNEKQSDDARNAHQQKFAPNSSECAPGRRTTMALAAALRGDHRPSIRSPFNANCGRPACVEGFPDDRRLVGEIGPQSQCTLCVATAPRGRLSPDTCRPQPRVRRPDLRLLEADGKSSERCREHADYLLRQRQLLCEAIPESSDLLCRLDRHLQHPRSSRPV